MHTPFGQQVHKVSVEQPETQIPAHGERDDVVGKAIAAEGRGGAVERWSGGAVGLTAVAGRALVDLPA